AHPRPHAHPRGHVLRAPPPRRRGAAALHLRRRRAALLDHVVRPGAQGDLQGPDVRGLLAPVPEREPGARGVALSRGGWGVAFARPSRRGPAMVYARGVIPRRTTHLWLALAALASLSACGSPEPAHDPPLVADPPLSAGGNGADEGALNTEME